MDETKARALVATWEHGDEAHRQWLRDTAMPGLLAFAAEVRRDERERAAALCDAHAKESEQERLAAKDQGVRACALWSRQSHEYDAKTIRALSPRAGPDPTGEHGAKP